MGPGSAGSREAQSVRLEHFKIGTVLCGQSGAEPDGDRRNHAIGQRAGAPPGTIEKGRSECGIGCQEWFRGEKQTFGEYLPGCIHWPAEKLGPGDGTDSKNVSPPVAQTRNLAWAGDPATVA